MEKCRILIFKGIVVVVPAPRLAVTTQAAAAAGPQERMAREWR